MEILVIISGSASVSCLEIDQVEGHATDGLVIERGHDVREVECAVLGNEAPEASVLGEIVPSNEFYDFDAKYVDDASELKIPAPLPGEQAARI